LGIATGSTLASFALNILNMKKLFFILAAWLCFTNTWSQADPPNDVFALPITVSQNAYNDKVCIVSITMPNDNFKIAEKHIGLLRRSPNNNSDTLTLGYGRCQLIKGDSYYFGIVVKDAVEWPKDGDLLYFYFDYPAAYKGYIYNLVQYGIYFKTVADSILFDFTTPNTLTEQGEKQMLNLLLEDVKYTATEMLKQMDEMQVEKGPYKGKPLFKTMQNITLAELKDFLDYVRVRPFKYSGNTWKISETFATWIFEGAPAVVK
jgi:hypothetical protein